jgi:hypothetical protein
MRIEFLAAVLATVSSFDFNGDGAIPRIELIQPVDNTFSEVPLVVEYSLSGNLGIELKSLQIISVLLNHFAQGFPTTQKERL